MIRRRLLILALIILLSVIALVFKLNYLYFILICFILIQIFLILENFLSMNNNKRKINRKLEIAQKELINNSNLCILIVSEKKIVWANDLTYSEFPNLLTDRSIDFINGNSKDIFIYNNNVYSFKENDNIYFIENITQEYEHYKHLEENSFNMAVLQFDNYNYLLEQLESDKFTNFNHNLIQKLIEFFDKYDIYYIKISKDSYKLIFPKNVLDKLIKERFTELNDIFKSYQEDSFAIRYSMGIALNQTNIKNIGKKADEALDLAVTRGGGQTIIFDGDVRTVLGGGSSVLSGNTMVKARLMYNTLHNLLKKKNYVYLMAHKNPDSDAIASLVLMVNLLKEICNLEIAVIVEREHFKDVERLVDTEITLMDEVDDVEERDDDLLFVLDTQSSTIIYNTEVIDVVSETVIIDHHQTPDNNIKDSILKWIEPSASSTVEMIMQMYLVAKLEVKNAELSNLAIFAILTDTNNLMYRVSELTLNALKTLVSFGGDLSIAKQMGFLDREEFINIEEIISRTIFINNMAVINLMDVDDIQLSIIANRLIEIKEITASIVINKIDDNKYIVKMRSLGNINCKNFLEEFNGGGHANQGAGILDFEKKEALLEKVQNYENGENK